VISVHAFADSEKAAAALAEALRARLSLVSVHPFPDGETLPTVAAPEQQALVYRSLHDPNPKLIEVLLSADALRRAGAQNLILVTPYLPYLRQDKVFRYGEPLSRDVVLPLLAGAFEYVVTVDPHLHRTAKLEDVAPQTRWIDVSGAEAMAQGLLAEGADAFDIVVGPDREAQQWVEVVARALALPTWTFEKRRHSDREVALLAPPGAAVQGSRVLLVDDICASGGTLLTAAQHLKAMGAQVVEAAVTHALYDARTAQRLVEAGVSRLRSCDGCAHPTNAFALAATIASALRAELIP